MIIDRNALSEYPYRGKFYMMEIDKSLPITQRVEKKKIVLDTECDIHEAQKTDSRGNITASFNVFFPIDTGRGVNIKRGMNFEGDFCGLRVNGKVVGVAPSQIGGCLCYIKDLDV